jgi:hypothetical protein
MKINEIVTEGKTGPGLWANIHAKQERIKHGSGEKMRKPGSKGAPTAKNFRDSASEGVAEETEKNPFEKGSMGHALWRDLSKTKKASPQQQQRNRERFAKRDAEKSMGLHASLEQHADDKMKELGHKFRPVDEGIGGDMAKLGGIAALGVGGALVGNYSDTQQPKVEIGGQIAFVEPAHSNVPDSAMTLTGKDGKTYRVWATKGTAQSSKRYHAVPVTQVKEQGVAEEAGTKGFRVTWSEAGSDKHTSGLLLKPGAIEHAKMLKKKPGTSNVKIVPYRQVSEMDGDGSGRDGSNRKRISSYGTRDRDISGPDIHLGAKNTMKRKDIVKRATSTLNKAFKTSKN